MSETNKERFLAICHEHIHREGINALLEALEKNDFYCDCLPLP